MLQQQEGVDTAPGFFCYCPFLSPLHLFPPIFLPLSTPLPLSSLLSPSPFFLPPSIPLSSPSLPSTLVIISDVSDSDAVEGEVRWRLFSLSSLCLLEADCSMFQVVHVSIGAYLSCRLSSPPCRWTRIFVWLNSSSQHLWWALCFHPLRSRWWSGGREGGIEGGMEGRRKRARGARGGRERFKTRRDGGVAGSLNSSWIIRGVCQSQHNQAVAAPCRESCWWHTGQVLWSLLVTNSKGLGSTWGF